MAERLEFDQQEKEQIRRLLFQKLSADHLSERAGHGSGE
jgi:hypothetical protein